MGILRKIIVFLVIAVVFLDCESSLEDASDSTLYEEKNQIELSYSIAKSQKDVSKRIAIMEEIDSLLDSGVAYNDKGKIYNSLSYLYGTTGEYKSAIHYGMKYLHHAKLLRDSSKVAKAYFKIGRYYGKLYTHDSAFYYYNKSKALYTSLNDSIKMAENCLNIAVIQSEVGNYPDSDELAIEGLKYVSKFSENIENSKAAKKTRRKKIDLIVRLKNCLAISAKERGDLEDALDNYEGAIQMAPRAIAKAMYINNKGNVFLERVEYDNAVNNYVAAMHIIDSLLGVEKEVEKQEEKLLVNRAKVQGNMAYANWNKTQNPKYIDQIKDALQLKIQMEDSLGMVSSYDHLSKAYESINRDKARAYALKMLETSKRTKKVKEEIEALKNLMASDDNSKRVIGYSKQLIHLKDSMVEAHMNAMNKYAKIKYQIEGRISDLRASNAEKQLSLERAKRQRTLATTVIIVLLLVSFVIYKNITVKHHQEKIAQVYQTETTISKKIHDEIANDVYNTMTKLQSQNMHQAEAIIDDLDHIYIRAREISREHGSIDFEDDFENILRDLLLNFKSEAVNIMARGLNKMSWPSMNPLKRATIYRVLQELLVNMKKHSSASMVIISFKMVKKKMVITYSDNGVGCDLKKKSGLLNVENRIRSFKGTINFRSEINNGFKAVIEV